MAEITSGTVYAAPLGDFWIGTLWLPATADDGDIVNLDTLVSPKIKDIVFATGINSTTSGTSQDTPMSWTSGSSRLTIGNSGTSGTSSVTSIDAGRSAVSNLRRDIFFIARS